MIQNGMILWNTKTGKAIHSEKDMSHQTESLAFTSDGKRLAFAAPKGLAVIETETGKLVDIYRSPAGLISEAVDAPLSFIFSGDDSLLFVDSNEVNGDQIIDLISKHKEIFSLCSSRFIRANNIGACFSKDKAILFDLSNGKKISEVDAPGIKTDEFNLAALSPDGKNFLYQTDDMTHIIDTQANTEIKALVFTTFDHVQTAMISLNGEEKYAAAIPNIRGQVDLVNLETGTLLQNYALPDSKIRGFALRPDGKIMASLTNDKMLQLWDIQSQNVIYQTTLSEYVQSPFTFSPDGLSIFFTNPNQDVLSFDFLKQANLQSSGRNSYSYSYTDSFVHNNYHFNKAGNLVMFRAAGNFPELRDTKTGEKKTLPFEMVSAKRYLEIEVFAISADEKFVAFGTTDDIYVWNLETMKQISVLRGHEAKSGDGWFGKISDLFFSPQSNLLVSVGFDGTTRLWNINSGQELRRLDVCCSATFTADGRFLLTAGNGVLRVWGIPSQP